MHRQLGELTVRERIIENRSGLSLVIRDKVNSPLETLELCFARLPKNEVTATGQKSLNAIEDSIHPLREFDCLVDWEQKEFPAPETLVKRLREDLEKQGAAWEAGMRLKSHAGAAIQPGKNGMPVGREGQSVVA